MKRNIMNLLTASTIIVTALGFTSIKEGGIQGRITPTEGVKEVLTLVGTDTVRSQMSNGNFIFGNLKRGTYNLIIKTNAPYKEATIQNVAVTDSATTDVGEIKLLQ